ncbi:MAG: S8 family serine peptidase, partial [Candidatus Kapaibacterium sp.]
VFASFSNWGAPVDFCAPGVGIESTKMGGGLTTMDGTSMASPHVAGILLLGPIGSRGNVTGDPDGKADPLAKVGP